MTRRLCSLSNENKFQYIPHIYFEARWKKCDGFVIGFDFFGPFWDCGMVYVKIHFKG